MMNSIYPGLKSSRWSIGVADYWCYKWGYLRIRSQFGVWWCLSEDFVRGEFAISFKGDVCSGSLYFQIRWYGQERFNS
jgi:hypothetical protein